jgi:hypothetical protein
VITDGTPGLRSGEKIGDIAGKRPKLLPLQRTPAVLPYFFTASQSASGDTQKILLTRASLDNSAITGTAY